ncbi:hypothetical protein TNCV_3290251 [Trichonephila clavipes]|nr:hypothetical protein TNCV_3290251 [Trichonephila clavipes]
MASLPSFPPTTVGGNERMSHSYKGSCLYRPAIVVSTKELTYSKLDPMTGSFSARFDDFQDDEKNAV